MKGKIIGTGSAVPDTVITNDELCRLIGFETVTPNWIKERTMIQQRRWADFDAVSGRRKPAGLLDTDLAEEAARKALENANTQTTEIDALIVVTCTPDEPHFSYPATELHRRLELSPDTTALHINSGCGGPAYAFDTADAYLRSGKRSTVLIVSRNLPSAHVDVNRYTRIEHEWFPVTVFGDGAGAVVLQATEDDDPSGILATYCGADGTHHLMSYPTGGARNPPSYDNIDDHKYLMDARMVKRLFAPLLDRSLEGIKKQYALDVDDITRLYLHQANGNLVQAYANRLGVPLSHVPLNITHYGNTSAASTLLLLDEDRRAGRIQTDDLILFLWVGAGAHYGGLLLRL